MGDRKSFKEKVKEFLWGLFFYEIWLDARRRSARYKDVMDLLLLGQFLGLPLMNSSISLRLLPYLMPELGDWKRRQLKEREIIEEAPPT